MIWICIVLGLPLCIFTCMLLWSIKKRIDISISQNEYEYSLLKKQEFDIKMNMVWNLFYESYLYVYSNQKLIPSSKEFLEFRRSFIGYFKMKSSEDELQSYYKAFYGEKIFDEYIEYEFLKRFQKVFMGSVLDDLISIVEEKKTKRNKLVKAD